MARIYDVVCLKCGEVYPWCKYDPPFERCEKCGAKLTTSDEEFVIEVGAYEFDVYPGWDRRKVKIFGVWSTSDQVRETSERIRAAFQERNF